VDVQLYRPPAAVEFGRPVEYAARLTNHYSVPLPAGTRVLFKPDG
jgi:hypothetical protein